MDDPDRQLLVENLQTKTIVPTSVAITEAAAIENSEHRIGLLTFMKFLGKDNRPLATPNEIITMACQGYSRRDRAIMRRGFSPNRAELWPLINSLPQWPMFLMGYACAIYQRAVKEEGFGHKNNPGHLDLWSATARLRTIHHGRQAAAPGAQDSQQGEVSPGNDPVLSRMARNASS